MSSLNDQSLKSLFAELPHHCIVLLEDVDMTAVHGTPGLSADRSQSVSQNGTADRKMSLSTLLNVLDGLASSGGRFFILTTNRIERLDPVLIRPDRVDMKIELHLSDRDMINQLFYFVYDTSSNTNVRDKEGVVEDCELLHLGQQFVAKAPELEFSPAEILSFLLTNKHSPHRAIANVTAWMEKLKEQRTRLNRITTWALEDNDVFRKH